MRPMGLFSAKNFNRMLSRISSGVTTQLKRCMSHTAANSSSTAHTRPSKAPPHAFTVRTTGRTGVEMEALTGVSTALLTIYDMCKAVDKSMELGEIHLVEKTGGKSGHYIRAEGGYV